jgi:hypothetical protein
MAQKRTSPWIYCGCGCIGCAGLVILSTFAAGFLGVSAFQGYLEDITDPQVRDQRAREILGTETLPEGYITQFYIRLPRILEIVLLTDGEPLMDAPNDEQGLTEDQFGEHVFAYVSVWDRDEQFDPFDEHSSGNVNVETGVRVRPLEDLGEGDFKTTGGLVRYKSHRGELVTDTHEVYEGLYSVLQVDCSSFDSRSRFGLWFYRTAATDDTDDTPADGHTLERFLEPFTFCR